MFPLIAKAGKSEAEEKFWQLPELIEELLKFLDLESTLQLARAHERTRNILQGRKVWNNLLKRSSLGWLSDVKPLVAILKLMKDTKSNLLDLLDAICEEHPSLENDNPFFDGSVQVRCPRHEGFHSISGRGFFLLEQVEKAFGTTELTVEAIALDTGDTWILQSLVSRLTSQQQELTSFYIRAVQLSSKSDAGIFKLLVQLKGSPPMVIRCVSVVAILGREGWRFLAEGLHSLPVLLENASTTKEALDGAKKEDLRVLWDALKPDGFLVVGTELVGGIEVEEHLHKQDGDAEWTRLCKIKDLSRDEWITEVEAGIEDEE